MFQNGNFFVIVADTKWLLPLTKPTPERPQLDLLDRAGPAKQTRPAMVWPYLCVLVCLIYFCPPGVLSQQSGGKKVMSEEFISWSTFWNRWELKIDLCLQSPVIKKLLFSIQFCHPDPCVVIFCLCWALSLTPESLVSNIHSMRVTMAELTLKKRIAREGVRETGREKK